MSCTELRWSVCSVLDCVFPAVCIRPATKPISSPCRIDTFLPLIHRTKVVGPVRAMVTDLWSPIPLAAGVIDPSDAQLDLLCGNLDDGSGCILANVFRYVSARDFLAVCVV